MKDQTEDMTVHTKRALYIFSVSRDHELTNLMHFEQYPSYPLSTLATALAQKQTTNCIFHVDDKVTNLLYLLTHAWSSINMTTAAINMC